jgi:alkanesulfonate monooxygenase SsuD/methylene tetrahydromethanopterin reductase-like flavin-dependent oxidoreductase (luciferase family)
MSIARYSRASSFVQMVSDIGFANDIAKVHEVVMEQGEAAASQLVPKELAEELALIGSPTDVVARIADFVEAGVNLPILTTRPWLGGGIKLIQDTMRALSPKNM